MIGGAILDISSSEFPGSGSGCSHDLSINWGELWPLEIGPIDIEGVLFPSVLKLEELPKGVLVFFGVDVLGNIGCRLDSDGFGDVVVDKGIGVTGCCGVVV